MRKFENDLILIFPYARSGSLFIHSLLDGHKDVICFPPVYSFTLLTSMTRSKLDLSKADVVADYLLSFINGRMLGNPCFREGEKNIFSYTNIQGECPFSTADFSGKFQSFYPLIVGDDSANLSHVFLCMMYAYDAALNQHDSLQTSASKKLVFQAHNFDYAWINWCVEHFNHVDLLHMVRQPLQSFYADIKSKLRQTELGILRFSNEVMTSLVRHILSGGYRYPDAAVNHVAVRLEDLHLNTQTTLEALAQVLNLSFDRSLLVSSFYGNPWQNFAGKEHVATFNQNFKHYDINDLIPPEDASVLGTLLLKHYQQWDYRVDFEILADPIAHFSERAMLMEYLPYIKQQERLRAAYDKGAAITREPTLDLLLRYCSDFDAPIVGYVS